MSEGNGNAGLRCPRCNCADLRVTKTMPLPGNRIRRYRTCRHCHKNLVSVESQLRPTRPRGDSHK